MEGVGPNLDAKQERLVKGGAGQDEKKVPGKRIVEQDGGAEAKMMGQSLGPSSKDWLVWQLVDSLLPTGGFAHSLGVEVSCHLCTFTAFTFSWYFWDFPCLRARLTRVGEDKVGYARRVVVYLLSLYVRTESRTALCLFGFRSLAFRFRALDKQVARSSFTKSTLHCRFTATSPFPRDLTSVINPKQAHGFQSNANSVALNSRSVFTFCSEQLFVARYVFYFFFISPPIKTAT
jgi:hypothetical protein